MKKYNKLDLNWVFVWIILPILIFLFSMNVVYAYYSSSTRDTEVAAATAIINIGFDNLSSSVTSGAVTSTVSKVVPGDTINFSGNVKNSGNTKLYCIIKYIVSLNDESVLLDKFYTAEGANLEYNGDRYTTDATMINVNGISNFTLSYTVPSDFDNSYQGKAIKLTAIAYAIQFDSIDNAVTAANLLALTIIS